MAPGPPAVFGAMTGPGGDVLPGGGVDDLGGPAEGVGRDGAAGPVAEVADLADHQARQAVHTNRFFGAFSTTAQKADIPLLLPGSSLRVSAKITGVRPGGRLHAMVQLAPYTTPVSLATTPVSASATAWAMPWGVRRDGGRT